MIAKKKGPVAAIYTDPQKQTIDKIPPDVGK